VPAPAVAPAQVLRLDDTPQLRYARWVRLEQRVQRGQALTPAEGTWFQGYPAGAEHRSMRDYFERFGLDAETVLAGAG
jgi:putative transposase